MPTNAADRLDVAPVIHLESVGSTNADLLARAQAGERGPLWLRADCQTSGRGRLGRAWTSPSGNLYASILLHDPADGRDLPQLAHVAAVALAEAVREVVGHEPALHLKWPNDLLFGGAKLAGILVEAIHSTHADCVIGWGVNCLSHPDGLPYETSDLSAVAGRPIAPDTVFAALRRATSDAVSTWSRGRNFEAIRAAWLSHGLPPGTPMSARRQAGTTAGTFAGIDHHGRLLLRTLDGLVTIEAGDINLSAETAAAVG